MAEEAKKMITEEQLKTVQEQQAKEIEATKKELEDEYGQVNIDLKDGSYVEIEKEDDKK